MRAATLEHGNFFCSKNSLRLKLSRAQTAQSHHSRGMRGALTYLKSLSTRAPEGLKAEDLGIPRGPT
eukprot:9366759-Pyramimonas_sp.AAC.1